MFLFLKKVNKLKCCSHILSHGLIFFLFYKSLRCKLCPMVCLFVPGYIIKLGHFKFWHNILCQHQQLFLKFKEHWYLVYSKNYKVKIQRSKKKIKQGDHDDAREITAVWCWNDIKTKFRGGHLGFLTGISQSILTKLCTRI